MKNLFTKPMLAWTLLDVVKLYTICGVVAAAFIYKDDIDDKVRELTGKKKETTV